jgi:hypothetical protein
MLLVYVCNDPMQGPRCGSWGAERQQETVLRPAFRLIPIVRTDLPADRGNTRDGVYDHRGSGPGVQPVGALEAGVQRRLAGDDTRFAGVAVNRRLGTVST